MSYMGEFLGQDVLYIPFTPQATVLIHQYCKVPPDGGYVRMAIPDPKKLQTADSPCPR